MAKFYKCSFCGREIPPGTGIVYVKRDGTVYRFCSSKCRKSMMVLRRDPRKFKWCEAYKKARRAGEKTR